eukprot:6898185-Pyramimonas_sp.AAC.1
MGPLGAVVRPRKAIGSEKARRQHSLMFLRLLKDVGLWAASWEVSEASWRRLGAFLRPLGASWEPLRGILGYLEPSWRSCWAL